MEKISIDELNGMIKSKFLEKGATEDDISTDVVKEMVNRIKTEVNKGIVRTQPEEEEIVNVNTAVETPEVSPGEEPEAITTSTEINTDSEEVYRKEGELEEKERQLATKEEELRRKEEELRRKEEELQYQPVIPEKIQDMGAEKLFVFDENMLSAGAEKLSKTEMNLVERPEEKTTMHDLWLNDGKKDAEVYIVKFEKVGNIIFDPFEGVSEFHSNITEEEPEETSYEESKEEMQGNMKDSIEPVKDVTQPMTNDMGLTVNNQEELDSRIEEIVKRYMASR
jgi:hypothetical protein